MLQEICCKNNVAKILTIFFKPDIMQLFTCKITFLRPIIKIKRLLLPMHGMYAEKIKNRKGL